jgi:Txe/YoeB family toxin of Txe-Axe toxin-antitoxin module
MTGFTQLLSNLMILVGILFLTMVAVFLIGTIKALLDVMILQSKTKKIHKQLNRIQKKATEILKDFHQGTSFMGLAKSEELGEEMKELERLSKELK